MRNISGQFRHLYQLASMPLSLIVDAVCCLGLCLRPSPALAAENLFLRKPLALYQERQVKPRWATNAIRIALVWLSPWFDWRRPPLPKDLRALIRRMVRENLTWGQERIADELVLKLGLRVSLRTVRKYMPSRRVGSPGKRGQSQRWSTFIRNQATGIVACDFCVTVTATFRILYVLVVMEHASRRLLHVTITAYPMAQWTLQQFRETIASDHTYRILIHDRDSIFSKPVDQSIRNMGLRLLRTPVRTPVVNAICERIIGTLRRECLDFVIPLNERHLDGILKEWAYHDNESRPPQSLGPGIPQPRAALPVSLQTSRHRLPTGQHVVSQSILNGLHHDYGIEPIAA